MTERTWVPFTAADQAQPGRRMRRSEHSSIWTVEKTGRRQGRAYIYLTGVVGALEIGWVKRARWQIEL